MSKRYIQLVQGGIHGLMEFRGMETSVIGLLATPEIQRLRRIHQLGLADLVYPDAEHSRQSHSLGAAYLAIRFGRRICELAAELLPPLLQPGPLEVRDFAIAALCHDLGHGPFSHAWEHECVGENFPRALWQRSLGLSLPEEEAKQLKWHEMVGLGLLMWDEGPLRKKLEEHEQGTAERIQSFLRGIYHIPYLPRLISSDLDIDRGDFLLRDGIQTGVTYGRYDIDWLISTIAFGYYDKQLVIGYDSRKARRAFEQFISARRALYETVYYHHTVKSAEVMMGLAFKRLKKCLSMTATSDWDKFKGFEPIVTVARNGALSPKDIMKLDDTLLWSFFHCLADNARDYDIILCDLSRRLVRRKLFKEVRMKKKVNTIPLHYKSLEKARELISSAIEYPKLSLEDISEYYYFRYRTDDELLSKKEREQSYFIDTTTTKAIASPVREDREFLPIRLQTVSTNRLYIADEARDAVQYILNG